LTYPLLDPTANNSPCVLNPPTLPNCTLVFVVGQLPTHLPVLISMTLAALFFHLDNAQIKPVYLFDDIFVIVVVRLVIYL